MLGWFRAEAALASRRNRSSAWPSFTTSSGKNSTRHTDPTACPALCRQRPFPHRQFSRECGSARDYFRGAGQNRTSALILKFFDFQVNLSTDQVRIKEIEVTGCMTGKPEVNCC